MSRSVHLVDPGIRSKYMEVKPTLQLAVSKYLSEHLSISQEVILHDSNASIGDNSLRFPFSNEMDSLISDTLIENLRSIVSEQTKLKLGVNRGKYHKNNKTVIEISMTTKGWAIDKFEEHLGIPKNKMVRIGDQGDNSGNDYEMLDNPCGFSVGKFSLSSEACWPIVSLQSGIPEILSGVYGTNELLNTLKIFPSICLETPNEQIYLPRLALSERKNNSSNRDTYDYYHNQLKHAFRDGKDHYSNVWDFIDEYTGGFLYT